MESLVDRLRRAVDGVDAVQAPPPRARRSAAVLLLFDPSTAGLPLLFLQRTDHLRHHPGQIGFPGGGREPGDSSPVTTALREASEEAGIPVEAAEVIGVLPSFVTATSDNWLTPVTALQVAAVDLRPDPFEVARLFRIELRALMDAPHTVRNLTHDEVTREVHFYEAEGEVIWGVTAAILAELIGRLGG